MKPSTKWLLRTFLLELIIYGILLVVYFQTVLPVLEEPINRIFYGNPYVYAGAALLLVVIQSVVLELGIATLLNGLGIGVPE